jgi:hypothetical protein
MSFWAPDVGERNFAEEQRDTLKTQIEMAPERYAMEAQYRPKYDELDLQSFNNALYGSGGNRGLLDMYTQDIAPQMSAVDRASQQAQREADIAAVEQFGPRATAAMRAVNPEQTALLDSITRQSTEDVQAGYNLPAGLQNVVNQSTRAGQAARGLGFGPADAYSETLRQSEAANQWHGQNLDRGMRVAATNAATQTDPFLAILGRPASSPAAAQGLLNQGISAGQGSQSVYGRFDPTNPYAQDLYNTNYNAQAASKIGGANAKAGIVSSAVGAL